MAGELNQDQFYMIVVLERKINKETLKWKTRKKFSYEVAAEMSM